MNNGWGWKEKSIWRAGEGERWVKEGRGKDREEKGEGKRERGKEKRGNAKEVKREEGGRGDLK